MKTEAEFLKKLEDFLNSPDRNRWIKTREIKIYVRKAMHSVQPQKSHNFIDLASIEVTKPNTNKGIFSHLLKKIIEKYPTSNFYIESVLNPVIDHITLKYGFVKQSVAQCEEFESYNLYLLRNI